MSKPIRPFIEVVAAIPDASQARSTLHSLWLPQVRGQHGVGPQLWPGAATLYLIVKRLDAHALDATDTWSAAA